MRKVAIHVKKTKDSTLYSYNVCFADDRHEHTTQENLEAVEHDIAELDDELRGLNHTVAILTKERGHLKSLRDLLKRKIEEASTNESNN